jgi:hypothetical protein
VTNGLDSITQAKQKCYQGVLGKDCWEEWLSASKLRHDIDKRKSEATQILLGRLGS